MSKKFIFFTGILLMLYTGCADKEGIPVVTPPGEEFKTRYKTMQLVGDFNGWALEDLNSTKMNLVADWTWEKLQYFSGKRDSIMFKIVPDGNWDLAFGTQGPDSGLSGYAEPNCSGTGNHITAGPIDRAGYWKFTFNEQTLYYSISFYSAPGGAIAGKVSFQDITSSPYPEALITALQGTNVIATTTSDTLNGKYILTPLPNGTYNVVFQASGYLPDTVYNIVVSNDTAEVNVTLNRAQGIMVDGDLSDWDTCAVYDTIGDSPWGNGGDLGSLYAKIVNDTLFIGAAAIVNNNAIIIYFHVEPEDSNLGYTDMNTIDFYPRKFTFPDSLKADYILAQWVDGNVQPAMRSIDSTGNTHDITPDVNIASTLTPGQKGAIEAAIPIGVITHGTTGRIGIVAVIAGGDHYDGPESVPSNGLHGNGTGATLQNLYFLSF